MKNLIVASAQQQMRLFDSMEEYRKELNRFLYMARAKGAGLVVFPGLAGVMAAAPMVEGFGVNLLRQAQDRVEKRRSFWRRTRDAVAGSAAALLRANFRTALGQLLAADANGLVAAYQELFGSLALAYDVTIIAGSAYLPDSTGVIRHRATVFGPDGNVLGRHDKMVLSAEDMGLATAGDTWTVVKTPVGGIGILLGEEALYPEAGRVLAYQGADLLVTLAAVDNPALAAYVRQSTIAQAQENRCFALTSFLVGKNYLAHDDSDGRMFVGKSGIYAPLEMTARYTGVLVEMGTASAEGLLTAELDRAQLREVWESGVEPVRRNMPVGLFAKYLPGLYSSRQTLADVWPSSESAAPPVVPATEHPEDSTMPPSLEPASPVLDREWLPGPKSDSEMASIGDLDSSLPPEPSAPFETSLPDLADSALPISHSEVAPDPSDMSELAYLPEIEMLDDDVASVMDESEPLADELERAAEEAEPEVRRFEDVSSSSASEAGEGGVEIASGDESGSTD